MDQWLVSPFTGNLRNLLNNYLHIHNKTEKFWSPPDTTLPESRSSGPECRIETGVIDSGVEPLSKVEGRTEKQTITPNYYGSSDQESVGRPLDSQDRVLLPKVLDTGFTLLLFQLLHHLQSGSIHTS